jgi:hypothetical protein
VDPGLRDSRPPVERYVNWRARCLRDAGFEDTVAERIASDRAWDLHALLQLVDRGCPPRLAERILAPLDEEVHAR